MRVILMPVCDACGVHPPAVEVRLGRPTEMLCRECAPGESTWVPLHVAAARVVAKAANAIERRRMTIEAERYATECASRALANRIDALTAGRAE